MYAWLKSIYFGKKEPSRNEFDQDYRGYLKEQQRLGEITEEQYEEYQNDVYRKIEFEIHNMFQTGHRVTYGRVSSFCPIIADYDLINVVE